MDRAPLASALPLDFAELPLPVVLQINELADDFEAAWHSGRRPQIEDFLAETDDRQRAALMHQLIALDADYRRRCGELPVADDYLSQFPDLNRDWLAQILCEDEPGWSAPADAVAGAKDTVELVPTRFGDYELLTEAGRGGMGVVFRARQRRLNRIVALKMILAGRLADEARIRRFHAEAGAAARLQHPGIVPVYEAGEHGGQHFLSMAFVEGTDLGALARRGPLHAEQAAKIIKDAAEAVHYAHQQGIIHRDLKPRNILIDQSGRPHVTDFGLAKDLRDNRTETATGIVLGTPEYMAPEQAEGRPEDVGPAADVYSLGATLYHLLTGQPPFRDTGPIQTLHRLLEREPTSPRSLNPAIPRDLETICLACLRMDPQRRYSSASALASDLGRWLNREPIRARPVARPERIWLWCRRKPAVAGLLAALVTVVLGAVAIGVEAHRQLRTEALVRQLLAAETADVPKIAEQHAAYRGRVSPVLHDAFAAAEANGDARKQLHAALALRVFDRGQVDYLRGRAFAVFDGADELARRGEWKHAARALDRAIALNPDELDWLMCSAKLRLYRGDVDGYRQRCREMLRRFRGNDQSIIAHKIAHTTLLVPDPVGDPDELLELAKVAVRSGQSIHVRSLAVAHFRQARFAEARKLLRQSASARYRGYMKAHTLFFLAMAHHHLGEPVEAQRRLADAVKVFERAAAGVENGNYGSSWRSWITVSVVRREAEALIHAAAMHRATIKSSRM